MIRGCFATNTLRRGHDRATLPILAGVIFKALQKKPPSPDQRFVLSKDVRFVLILIWQVFGDGTSATEKESAPPKLASTKHCQYHEEAQFTDPNVKEKNYTW